MLDGKPVLALSQVTKLSMKPAAICWTTTIGTGNVLGRAVKILCSTAGPPVEAPMATSLIAGDTCLATTTGAGPRGPSFTWRGHRLMTFTSVSYTHLRA